MEQGSVNSKASGPGVVWEDCPPTSILDAMESLDMEGGDMINRPSSSRHRRPDRPCTGPLPLEMLSRQEGNLKVVFVGCCGLGRPSMETEHLGGLG